MVVSRDSVVIKKGAPFIVSSTVKSKSLRLVVAEESIGHRRIRLDVIVESGEVGWGGEEDAHLISIGHTFQGGGIRAT
jgi:hypothetical protein